MIVNIESTLKASGIEFIEDNDIYGSTIASSDDGRKFPIVFFEWTAEDEQVYVRLIIVPFIERPGEGFAYDLVEHVLFINEHLPRAKFLLDSDGDLGLAVDIAADEWNPDNLKRSLDMLSQFSEYYYDELESLFTGD